MTSFYAVWGNPITQSQSPVIHHKFASLCGKSINYTAKLGDLVEFETQLKQFFLQGAKGCNITAPFKERAFKLSDIQSQRCLMAEACNTLMFLPNGKLYADNTDGAGLVSDLKRLNRLKKNQEVLILGAGGATRGVLHDLLMAEQKITLVNRMIEKAEYLANKFREYGTIKVCNYHHIPEHNYNLIINATSSGLQQSIPPIPSSILAKAKAVYDMQYTLSSLDTPFLKYAKSVNITHVADGIGMLVAQAAHSFFLWEKVMPNIDEVLAWIYQQKQ